MRKSLAFVSGMTILSVILSLDCCLAAMVIEQRVKDREGNQSKVVLWTSGDRLRTDEEGSRLTTIVDLKADRLVMIDHRAKEYVDVKFSRWEKEISEDLRKGAPQAPSRDRQINVKRTGETEIINGFKTEKIQVLAGGERIEEHWMTRDVDARELERIVERMSQGFLKTFRSQMKESREIQEKLKPFGFSIRIRDYAVTHGLGGIDVMEVMRIKTGDLPEAIFNPPGDYQRIVPETRRK